MASVVLALCWLASVGPAERLEIRPFRVLVLSQSLSQYVFLSLRTLTTAAGKS